VNGDGDTVTAITAVTDVTSVAAGKGPPKDSVLLGKYRVEATLGFGGMGLVIRAHNMDIDERVAMKFLREDVQLESEHVERFLREAKACVRLKSEHVAKIRDVGTLEDGRPFMVMELLEGLDLGKLLVEQGSIDPNRAVDLILQACDALAEAHTLGIVHRDIKPTNLFLTKRRDESDLLKVLDFGISKAQAGPEMSLTQTSSMLGTPAYMSPEQMRSARTADRRSDIWGLGTVLYELVEGRLPFEAASFAELCVMVATEPPAAMTKAPHLQRVMERCLAKPLEERYQDIGELAFDLAPYASDPGRASRQVARILRVLGSPPSRDSTPMPATMTRDNVKKLSPITRDGLQRISGAIPGASVASVPGSGPVLQRTSSGIWKSIVLLVLLFGIGIGAGLYVTSTGGIPEQAAEAARDGGGAATSGAATTDATSAEITQAVTDNAHIDAGTVGSGPVETVSVDGGVPTTQSVTAPIKPPVRKPPVRKPPVVRRPPTQVTGAGSGSAAPSPPKRCDPFANAKGCT
jgi:eukaryotic-like serine/threonine-protein kinase